MSPKEWFENPALGQLLKEEMQKEIWQVAFQVWRELSYASLYADTPPTAISTCGDAVAGKILGYEKAIKSLQSLSTPLPPQPDQLIETMGVEKPEDATE